MRRIQPIVWLILAGVVLLIGFGAMLIYLFAPRAIAEAPFNQQGTTSAASFFRLAFNRPMNKESVAAHLEINPSLAGEIRWEGNSLTFLPDSPWPHNSTVSVTLRIFARGANWPGLPTLQEYRWSFEVGEPQVLYLAPVNGPADLYMHNLATGQSRRMTTVQGGILSYSVSRDGRQVFYATRGGDIYNIDLQGGEPVLAVNCTKSTCSDPQVSMDGTRLAYVRTPQGNSGERSYPQVWVKNLIGEDGQTEEPQPAKPAARSGSFPRWSNDGWLAYYDEIKQVYHLWNPHSDELISVPNQTGEPGAWSGDGRYFIAPEIIFIPNAYVGSSGRLEPMPTSHLMLYDRESGELSDISLDATVEDTTPVASPDGRWLAFARKYLEPARWTPGRQIWMISSSGGEARALTDDPNYNFSAFAWNPDGSRLAYVRANQASFDEPTQIWVTDFDGSDAHLLVSGGYLPAWTP